MIDCGTYPFLVEKPAIFVRLCHARTPLQPATEARAHADAAALAPGASSARRILLQRG